MNITVTGPKFGAPYSKSVAQIIEGAISVMCCKLGIAHEPIEFEILLGRTAEKYDGDARGWAHAHRAKNKWIATIFVMREHDITQMISTLAHELIHIKQFVKDGLDLNTLNFKGKKWKAKKNQDVCYDSPWEREAYSKELILLDHYLKYIAKNG